MHRSDRPTDLMLVPAFSRYIIGIICVKFGSYVGQNPLVSTYMHLEGENVSKLGRNQDKIAPKDSTYGSP